MLNVSAPVLLFEVPTQENVCVLEVKYTVSFLHILSGKTLLIQCLLW